MPYLIIDKNLDVERLDNLTGSKLERAKRDVKEGWAKVFRIGPEIKQMYCPNGIGYDWIRVEHK
jgi:hypothetical protein